MKKMAQPLPRHAPPPPTPQDVAALVRRATEGDAGAFSRLVAQFQPKVLSFAMAFTSDRDEASDLAQEAMIKVYRAIASYRFESAFSTWLFRIVKNTFLDAYKSRAAKERAMETTIEGELHHLEEAALAEDRLLRAETRRGVWRALKKVPVPYRMVVVLFDIQGFPYDEIARVLDLPLGTVKSRLKRGRDALREEIFRSRELP
jgi:RNA polymerase sigma-70 factor (ECF subfamily)